MSVDALACMYWRTDADRQRQKAVNAARVRRKNTKKNLRCLLTCGGTAAGGRRGCMQGCGRAGVRMRDRQTKKKEVSNTCIPKDNLYLTRGRAYMRTRCV